VYNNKYKNIIVYDRHSKKLGENEALEIMTKSFGKFKCNVVQIELCEINLNQTVSKTNIL